jgi:hypothetical protein
MKSRIKPRRWTVADRISVAVVLGAIVVIGFGLQSGAIGRVHQEPVEQVSTTLAAWAGGCDETCGHVPLGISGDPATGTPYPR